MNKNNKTPPLSRNLVSARNSSYWLGLVSDQKLRHLSSNELRNSNATDVIYEHRRYNLFLGWKSSSHWLPNDPAKFTSEDYKHSYKSFPKIELPTNDGSNNYTWQWTSTWYLADEADVHGWKYGTTFASLKSSGGGSSTYLRTKHFVKRRRWIRNRVKVPFRSIPPELFILDASTHIDKVSGYLLLKNTTQYKWRFVALSGSTLRLYTDSTRSRLKREVLCFHPSTAVHALDVHTTGKPYSFKVESEDDQSLIFQARSSQEQESWIYAIEEAILARDSYNPSDKSAVKVREAVVRRRSISIELQRLGGYSSPTTNNRSRSSDDIEKIIQRRIPTLEKKFIKGFQSEFHKPRNTEFSQTALASYRNAIETILSVVLADSSSFDTDDNTTYGQTRETALHEIERLVFLPLQDTIYNHLQSGDGIILFLKNQRRLQASSQSFFEIKTQHISPSEYQAAANLLDSIDEYSLPFEKASLLVKVANCISSTIHTEHKNTTQVVLAADDFLPIFIYVVVNSKCSNIVLTTKLLSGTLIHSISVGEVGYYVTMLEAAVEYITTY